MPGDPVLRFNRATIGYPGNAVLTGLDLDLRAGERLALVGPNGAGKSTLIKSVLGLAAVLGGAVEVFGRSPGRAGGLCGYVPQAADLDPDFPVTAGHVVLMGRYRRTGWWRPTRPADRRAARAALDRVGLADRAGVRFGLLSGGQRQRVLLARAIAAEPSLLLLDEPFNGVDAESQQAILTVLAELTTAGAALVLSTHDEPLAERFADRVLTVAPAASGSSGASVGRTVPLARAAEGSSGASVSWTVPVARAAEESSGASVGRTVPVARAAEESSGASVGRALTVAPAAGRSSGVRPARGC
ncbi:ABC-type Mn2+/Zn2+ transport system ATPase subunit [Actinoplanes octamycinicus]|uniref:ABC-type Mn2+/Zn2+ transport system ATPase subunit n=1 Tax=Actinoplanes octamycinicus TaxID=135948 RepID=A0A7W7MCP1_9ACTN|nr:ATP-binding cassette domain-containing protein [Actinoplanes octamycinicus]MBB4745020.1 ABC-type Mn2+/Zn2+ transport system ATPase subunit [Actinoplanes octamycinicus]